MKRKIQIITVAAVIMALVMSTTALATIGVRAVELAYNNIKLMVNGKDVVPADANGNAIEPFIIDGTTYLPVRGVANALGHEVGWDAATSTVTLNTPGAFTGGVQVYEDEYVTIDFAGCRKGDKYYEDYYYADFYVTNRTDLELSFQSDSMSFNGISYNSLSGSDEVAPQSTGKISFYTSKDIFPLSGINKTSGKIRVIDFSYNKAFNGKDSYEAKWINITK